MKNAWMLFTSGTIALLVGVIQILLAFFVLGLYLLSRVPPGDVQLHQAVVFVVVIPFLVSGGIGITGGVFTILKKKWLVSLIFNIFTGAIFVLGLLGIFPKLQYFWVIVVLAVGVAPTVFLVLSKNQFALKNHRN
jgi:hypothetical protein